jgi:histidinol dehydrogenase
MIRTLDLRGQALSKAGYQRAIPRASLDIATAMRTIEPILERVKNGSESDLLNLAQEFDGVMPASIRVSQSDLDVALKNLDPAVRTALELSISRIRKVHTDQIRTDKSTKVVDGGVVTERWIPVDRVGLYVPGGRAVYPSSVLMNVIPAQIAEVSSIAVASPPQKEFGGLPHPTILAACALLGITEVLCNRGSTSNCALCLRNGRSLRKM